MTATANFFPATDSTIPQGCYAAINTPESHADCVCLPGGKFVERFGLPAESKAKEVVLVSVLTDDTAWDDRKQDEYDMYYQYYFQSREDALAFARQQTLVRVYAIPTTLVAIGNYEEQKFVEQKRMLRPMNNEAEEIFRQGEKEWLWD